MTTYRTCPRTGASRNVVAPGVEGSWIQRARSAALVGSR